MTLREGTIHVLRAVVTGAWFGLLVLAFGCFLLVAWTEEVLESKPTEVRDGTR